MTTLMPCYRDGVRGRLGGDASIECARGWQ
jgi:hypothetical protein